MNLAIENRRKNLILALLIFFNFAFLAIYIEAQQQKGCSSVVNYWTDIVTRQLFSVHSSSILVGALVRWFTLARSVALDRLWPFLSFPAPTGLARSADPIVLEQRFYLGWRNLVIFGPRNWEILGNIFFF
jgi:hypothetical protein